MVQGQVFFKTGGGVLTLFLFHFFKVYHFYIQKLPFAKLWYAFEEKKIFSATIILWKKVILSRLKINLKVSHLIN